MRVAPQGDRLYVRLDPMVEKVKNIFVPDDHREPSRIATIKEVGPEVKKFKVGDRILVSFYTGVPINLPQYDLDPALDKIATESEILALVHEEGTE